MQSTVSHSSYAGDSFDDIASFAKSFKRYASRSRLSEILKDAGLEEKNEQPFVLFIESVFDACEKALEESDLKSAAPNRGRQKKSHGDSDGYEDADGENDSDGGYGEADEKKLKSSEALSVTVEGQVFDVKELLQRRSEMELLHEKVCRVVRIRTCE